jgi:hypothetical protein
VPSYMQEKYDFVCESEDSDTHLYNPFILVFAVFGTILLTLMCCICIIVLRLKGIICQGRGGRRQEIDGMRLEREEETRKKLIKRLDEVLPSKEF